MTDKKQPAETQSLHERVALSRQKSTWQQTVILAAAVLIVGVGLVHYGLPAVKGDGGDLFIIAILAVAAYLIFRRRRQDIDAETLVAVAEQYWKGSSLQHHSWNQLDFSLPNIRIEQVTDGFHLVSCDNQFGGTKTLGIHGTDGRSLRVVPIFNGDATAARKTLEKSKFMEIALEKGEKLKEVEAMLDRI